MIEVSAPRVDDRREGEHFSSAILPAYMRKSPKVTEVLPILYLRGLRRGTSSPPSRSSSAPTAGLSASSVNRLTVALQAEHAEWSEPLPLRRRLRVLLGRRRALQRPPRRGPSVRPGHRGRASRRDQRAGPLADGHRESTDSWAEVLRGLKHRGLSAPVLAVGDGALGFWAALRRHSPTRDQRCWVHVTANCLDALPKRLHADAKDAIAKIYSAPCALTRSRRSRPSPTSSAPRQGGEEDHRPARRPVGLLRLPRGALDPPEHHEPDRVHLLNGAPSHQGHQGAGSRKAGLAMAYKLLDAAQDRWRRINGHELVPLVRAGATFIDGKLQERSVTTTDSDSNTGSVAA